MDYLELSLESLRIESIHLAKNIATSFRPDIVVYVAKGGYLIGKDIAEYFQIPYLGIYAQREGNEAKAKLASVLKRLPRVITKFLRQVELKSGLHKTVKERQIFWDPDDNCLEKIKDAHKILLVDDSVDTGYSMKNILPYVFKAVAEPIEIRIAAINVWSKSESIIRTDFYNYRDTIIATPMSNDSREHDQFLQQYANRHGKHKKF
jgi:hypoxanthine phosphoribosyltransferase